MHGYDSTRLFWMLVALGAATGLFSALVGAVVVFWMRPDFIPRTEVALGERLVSGVVLYAFLFLVFTPEIAGAPSSMRWAVVLGASIGSSVAWCSVVVWTFVKEWQRKD